MINLGSEIHGLGLLFRSRLDGLSLGGAPSVLPTYFLRPPDQSALF